MVSFAFFSAKKVRAFNLDVVVSLGRSLQQDIVFSSGGTHLSYLRQTHPPSVGKGVQARFSLYDRAKIAIEKAQFRRMHQKVLGVSNRVRRELVRDYRVPWSSIEVVYGGLAEPWYRQQTETKEALRRRLGVPVEPPIALFVGNGFRRKGMDTLLGTWPLIKNQAKLVVVGDDRRLASYRRRGEELGVLFVGQQMDLSNFYGAADVLVLPTLHEAFGFVVLEALAMGLPVIVSRIAGASEILDGEMREFILDDPSDNQELRSKIERVLSLDVEQKKSLRETAIRTAASFPVSKMIDGVERWCEWVKRPAEAIPDWVRSDAWVSVQNKAQSGVTGFIQHSLCSAETIASLMNPDSLIQRHGATLLWDTGKSRVAFLSTGLRSNRGSGEGHLYLKHHYAGLSRQIATLFGRSPSRHAWEAGRVLARAGFRSAEPVAMVEFRGNSRRRESLYVTRAISKGTPVHEYWLKLMEEGCWPLRRRRSFLRALADYCASLHRSGLYHGDLKDGNIVVREEEGRWFFYLIDLEDLSLVLPALMPFRVRNLVQLDRSLGKKATRHDKFCFLRHYLKAMEVPRKHTSRWVERILSASLKKERRNRRKLGRQAAKMARTRHDQ
jgi:UDP-glucose:(heptosyl)LPS alpha-1,3-glucosyltransferase